MTKPLSLESGFFVFPNATTQAQHKPTKVATKKSCHKDCQKQGKAATKNLRAKYRTNPVPPPLFLQYNSFYFIIELTGKTL